MLALKSLYRGSLTFLELNYTGSLIKETSSVTGSSVYYRIDLSLSYDGIALTAYTRIIEKLLDILKPYRLTVDHIIGLSGSEELTGYRYLGIVHRQDFV